MDSDSPFRQGQPAPQPKMPPCRTFKVRTFDPVEHVTNTEQYGGHAMIVKEDGSLVIVEMQISPVTGQPLERIVQIIPSGEWDRAWEEYTPSSTIIN